MKLIQGQTYYIKYSSSFCHLASCYKDITLKLYNNNEIYKAIFVGEINLGTRPESKRNIFYTFNNNYIMFSLDDIESYVVNIDNIINEKEKLEKRLAEINKILKN